VSSLHTGTANVHGPEEIVQVFAAAASSSSSLMCVVFSESPYDYGKATSQDRVFIHADGNEVPRLVLSSCLEMGLVRLVWSTLQGRLSESQTSPQARNTLYRRCEIHREMGSELYGDSARACRPPPMARSDQSTRRWIVVQTQVSGRPIRKALLPRHLATVLQAWAIEPGTSRWYCSDTGHVTCRSVM
jgi:hypothetical protein